jgi:hypothetical protein
MRAFARDLAYWQGANFIESHCVVTRQLLVFGRDFSRSVGELPRGISKYGRDLLSSHKSEKVWADV